MKVWGWTYQREFVGFRAGKVWAINSEIDTAPNLCIWHWHKGTKWRKTITWEKWQNGDWKCSHCNREAPPRVRELVGFLMLGQWVK